MEENSFSQLNLLCYTRVITTPYFTCLTEVMNGKRMLCSQGKFYNPTSYTKLDYIQHIHVSQTEKL